MESRVVRFCAAAAGPTISVNTSSTPTICVHAATASAAIARNSTDTSRSDTPLASASSGCSEANSNGRMIAASASKTDNAQRRQHAERGRIHAQHVAEQQRGDLRRVSGKEVQKQQAEAEREREDHANRHIASGEPLAERAHADARRQREADHPPDRRDADQHRAGRAGEADVRERVAGEGLTAHHQKIADNPRQHRDDPRRRECVHHEIVFKHRSCVRRVRRDGEPWPCGDRA